MEISSLYAFAQSACATKPLSKDESFAVEETLEIEHVYIKLEKDDIDYKDNLHTLKYDREHNSIADPLAFDDTKSGDFTIKSEEKNLNECIKVESCNSHIATDVTGDAREVDNCDVPEQKERIQEIFAVENVQPAIKKEKPGKISAEGRRENNIKICDVSVVLRRIKIINGDEGVQYVLPRENTGAAPSKKDLKQRQRSINLPFACGHSSAPFSQKKTLLAHERKHLGLQCFACDKCSATFINKSSFVIHQRKHTGERPFVFTECTASCAQKPQLVEHQRSHTGERPYACYYCSATFTQTSYRTLHQRYHTGVPAFVCNKCSAAFATRNNFVLHTQLHTGERPYACYRCSATFVQSISLALHKWRQTEEESYTTCIFCSATFTPRLQLEVHQRKHTGKQPYACNECSATFAIRSKFAQLFRKRRASNLTLGKSALSLSSTTTASSDSGNVGDKLYTCDVCFSVFVTERTFANHILKHKL